MIQLGNKKIVQIFFGQKKVKSVIYNGQDILGGGATPTPPPPEPEPEGPKYPCQGIALDAHSLTFTDKNAKTLHATVQPSNCDEPIIWSPRESNIATVNEGTVTPHNNGRIKVRVSCGQYSDECEVSVSISDVQHPCTGVSLYPWTLKFFPPYDKDAKQLELTITPPECDEPVVWSCATPGIVDVSKSGLVTPLKRGRTEIKATCGAYSATSDAIVDFDPGPVACEKITVHPSSLTFKDETTKPISYNVMPNVCNLPVTAEITPSNVASIDTSSWIITPLADGDAQLKLTCGNQTAVCSLHVSLPKNGTEGCQYFNPTITMVGDKARLEQDGYVEMFDVSYTPNVSPSGDKHPDYGGYKEIRANGEVYYLTLLKRGHSLFAIDGMRPDSGAWTRDYGFAEMSLLGFTEDGSLDCPVQNLNNTVNQKLIDLGLPRINQSFKGLNFHIVPSSKNTIDVGTYQDTWMGLNVMSYDHMNIHFNGPQMNRYYGGVTDARYPSKDGVNRQWLSTFVHEFGHTFGVMDEAPHIPSIYNYDRDRNKCLYLQPNDLKCIQDNILKDWGVFLERVQDQNFNVRMMSRSMMSMGSCPSKRNKAATEYHFDYDEEDLFDKSDSVVQCSLSYLRTEEIDVGNGLKLMYDIYRICNPIMVKGTLENDELKIHVSHHQNIVESKTYSLMLVKFDGCPNSLINPKMALK